MIELMEPQNNVTVSLLTDVLREFMQRERAGEHRCPDGSKTYDEIYHWLDEKYVHDFWGDYVSNPDRLNLTKPQYIKFTWRADIPCHLEIFRDAKFPNDPLAAHVTPTVFDNGVYSATAGNMFMRTEYTWQVVADDGSQRSEVRAFFTADEFPRTVYAKGIANIRDIGAWTTYDGRHVRQGCIYRGAALDYECSSEYKLSPEGNYVLGEVVKIKNDADIRYDSVDKLHKSEIDGVAFHHLVCRGCENFYIEMNFAHLKRVVEFFADENNYPIYFHCAAGADRTGTLAFFLGILLGVPVDQLVADYNLTALTVTARRCLTLAYGTDRGRFEGGQQEGEPIEVTAMRNSERFLMETCGVSRDTIDKLRSNLIEQQKGERT